jgi:hypothetical protein
MRSRLRIIPVTRRVMFLFLLLTYAAVGTLDAVGPNFINYRASLTDTLGNPVPDSTYLVHFGIYDVETGGTALWTEDHSVLTHNGGFKVKLGQYNSLHDSVFADSLRWLGIAVDPDPEMVPRSIIGSVPWAINSAFADKVKDKSVGKDQLKDKAVGKDQLDSAAVDTDKIKGKAVGKAELKDKAVGKDQLDSLAVTKDKISNGAVGLKKLAQEGALPGQVIKWDGVDWVIANDSVGTDDGDWMLVGTNVLTTQGAWGIARAGATLHGELDSTHVNLGGGGSETGFSSSDFEFAVVSGGSGNRATNDHSTVSGGLNNIAGAKAATVGGGEGNTAGYSHTTVAGGKLNGAYGTGSTVGGGQENNIMNGEWSTISGGSSNTSNAQFATIAGGENNDITDHHAFIGGGASNSASGAEATIVGGVQNMAGGVGASVGGGHFNVAEGHMATIPGGKGNRASGEGSFAAGVASKAEHTGAVVISANSDGNVPTDSTMSGQAGQMVLRADGRFYFTDSYETAPSGGTKFIDTSTGAYLSAGGTWQDFSDENAKENFEPVDLNDLLERIAALDVMRWNYKVEDPNVQHIGPMAQDFHRQFGLGLDDKTISSLDAAGIALAAIKALHEKTTELEKTSRETDELKRRIDELTKMVELLLRERSVTKEDER